MMERSTRRVTAEYRAPPGEKIEEIGSVAGAEALMAMARIADGGRDEADIMRLEVALDIFFNTNGMVSLERGLGLPSTSTGLLLLRRDNQLRKAAQLIGDGTVSKKSRKLAAEWTRFISVKWKIWGDDSDPPVEATPLSKALFWATRFNRSKVLGAKRIEQIIGNIFDK